MSKTQSSVLLDCSCSQRRQAAVACSFFNTQTLGPKTYASVWKTPQSTGKQRCHSIFPAVHVWSTNTASPKSVIEFSIPGFWAQLSWYLRALWLYWQQWTSIWQNASNAPGQQKAVPLGQNNTIRIYFWFLRLCSPPKKTLSPFPRANTPKVPLNCQHHPRKSWNQDFFFFFFHGAK